MGVQFDSDGNVLSLVVRDAWGVHCGMPVEWHRVRPPFTVGDPRWSAMKTNRALLRALAAIRYGCHVNNLRYGEGCIVSKHW